MTEGEPQAIDFDFLHNLEQDTSRALMPELVDIFLKTAATRLDHMKSAIGNADTKTVAQEAHALKGSSSTFGAKDMHRLCMAMENAANEGRHDDLGALASDLDQAFKVTQNKLTEYVRSLTDVSD